MKTSFGLKLILFIGKLINAEYEMTTSFNNKAYLTSVVGTHV